MDVYGFSLIFALFDVIAIVLLYKVLKINTKSDKDNPLNILNVIVVRNLDALKINGFVPALGIFIYESFIIALLTYFSIYVFDVLFSYTYPVWFFVFGAFLVRIIYITISLLVLKRK